MINAGVKFNIKKETVFVRFLKWLIVALIMSIIISVTSSVWYTGLISLLPLSLFAFWNAKHDIAVKEKERLEHQKRYLVYQVFNEVGKPELACLLGRELSVPEEMLIRDLMEDGNNWEIVKRLIVDSHSFGKLTK